VPQKGRSGILFRHSAAVVHDPDEPFARLFNVDENLIRAGVDSVFDQLFDNGSRPLDHLAGRNLVHNMVREYFDN
jgi:hypothetical protein